MLGNISLDSNRGMSDPEQRFPSLRQDSETMRESFVQEWSNNSLIVSLSCFIDNLTLLTQQSVDP